MNNELKLMAIKAKSRLLNKGLREIYSTTQNPYSNKSQEYEIKPSLDIMDDSTRKKHILNMIKSHQL